MLESAPRKQGSGRAGKGGARGRRNSSGWERLGVGGNATGAADGLEEVDGTATISVSKVMVKDSLYTDTLHLLFSLFGFMCVCIAATQVSSAWVSGRAHALTTDLVEAGAFPAPGTASEGTFKTRARVRALGDYLMAAGPNGFLKPGVRVLSVMLEQQRVKAVPKADAHCVQAAAELKPAKGRTLLTKMPDASVPFGAEVPVISRDAGTEDVPDGTVCMTLATDGQTFLSDETMASGPFTAADASGKNHTYVSHVGDFSSQALYSQLLFVPLRFDPEGARENARILADTFIDGSSASLRMYVTVADGASGVFYQLFSEQHMLVADGGSDDSDVALRSLTISHIVPSWTLLSNVRFWFVTLGMLAWGFYSLYCEWCNLRDAKKYDGTHWAYFGSAWNFNDAISLLLFTMGATALLFFVLPWIAAFEADFVAMSNDIVTKLPGNETRLAPTATFDFGNPVWGTFWRTYFVRNFLCAYATVVFIQVVQATRFHPVLSILIRSLEVVAAPLIDFTVFFVVIIASFAALSFLVLSFQSDSYQEWNTAMWSTYQLALGVLEMEIFAQVSVAAEVQQVMRFAIGSIMFVCLLVAPNVLLAVVMDGFAIAAENARSYGVSFVTELPTVMLMVLERPFDTWASQHTKARVREVMESLGVPPPPHRALTGKVLDEWKQLKYYIDRKQGVMHPDLVAKQPAANISRTLSKASERWRGGHHTYSQAFADYIMMRGVEIEASQGSKQSRLGKAMTKIRLGSSRVALATVAARGAFATTDKAGAGASRAPRAARGRNRAAREAPEGAGDASPGPAAGSEDM